MLIPGVHDTSIVKGASWSFDVQWFVTGSEVPVDLTGWTGTLRIKKSKGAPDSLVSLTTENGKLTLDDQGNVSARMTKAEVETLPLAYGLWYELELSSSEESVQLLAGRVRVDP